MRKIFMIGLMLIVSCGIGSPMNVSETIEIKRTPIEKIVEVERDTIAEYIDKVAPLLSKMSMSESSGDVRVVNRFGYRGKYQFGDAALKDVGYGHVTLKAFKNDTTIFTERDQDIAMIRYLKFNKRILRRYIKKYEGTVINGLEITESGMLGAAHLAGAGGVQKYLRSGGKFNPSDANGTTLEDYMKKFEGHKLNLDLIMV